MPGNDPAAKPGYGLLHAGQDLWEFPPGWPFPPDKR